MKRILILTACFIALTCVCFAQDVIVTKLGSRINANVLEVKNDNVWFKYFDKPAGSTFSIQTSKVSRIEYRNGLTQWFETEVTTPQPTTPARVQPQNQRTQTSQQTQPAQTTQRTANPPAQTQSQSRTQTTVATPTQSQSRTTAAQPTAQDRQQQQAATVENRYNPANPPVNQSPIRNDNEITFYEGNYYIGSRRLTDREVAQMFNNVRGFSVDNQSKKWNRAGTWLIAGGSAFLVGGISLYAYEASHRGKAYVDSWFGDGQFPLSRIYTTGIVIGGVAITGGIYCKIKSGKLKNNSTYNQTSGRQYNDYSMNIGLTGNGIGLRLDF